MSSSAVDIGKQLLTKIASDVLFGGSLTSLDGKQRVGMVNGDGTQLDSKYRVSIISTSLNKVITGYLQDRTNLKVLSDWQPFITFGKDTISRGAEKLFQLGGKSLQNMAFSRRMWMGTSPIKMSLSLTFEAITDAMSEVIEPCKAILKLASPSRYGTFDSGSFMKAVTSKGMPTSLSDLGGTIAEAFGAANISLNDSSGGFFLAPPGPYPFKETSGQGDNISIQIGEYLQFEPVIVSAAEVDFDTRIDANGCPISAKAKIDFETYQVFGKQDIESAFNSTMKSNSILGTAKKLLANAAGFV